MKNLLPIFIVLLLACNTQIKNKPATASIQKIDTVFLNPEFVKGKIWIERPISLTENQKVMMWSFINDTVIKYYFAGSPQCWEENYRSWERGYDCYKFYNDTLETIAKLYNNPKNDNKYLISELSWSREYYHFKFFINPDEDRFKDTILTIKNNTSLGWRMHTLSVFRTRNKLKYPLLLDK